jgi:serine/threonine protein kinase
VVSDIADCDLRGLLDQEPGLSGPVRLKIAKQMTEGLSYLHSMHLIHRGTIPQSFLSSLSSSSFPSSSLSLHLFLRRSQESQHLGFQPRGCGWTECEDCRFWIVQSGRQNNDCLFRNSTMACSRSHQSW